MPETGTLRIHTRMGTEPATQDAPPAGGKRARRPALFRRRDGTRRLSSGDRLLRNSAIACAVLLGILALGNIKQPWAEKAAQSVRQALSMHIDLDDSIGELTFVKQLMPESALVFLNVSGTSDFASPTDAALRHPWSNLQPWLMYEAGNSPVYAVGAGTVTAISPLSDGRSGVLVDHGQGLETLYAGLDEVAVQSGDEVGRGQRLGASVDGLYFELRQDGESVDPAARLGQ